MKQFIKLTKFFIEESIGKKHDNGRFSKHGCKGGYMQGYSKLYIYLRMPKAYIKFMWYTLNTKER